MDPTGAWLALGKAKYELIISLPVYSRSLTFIYILSGISRETSLVEKPLKTWKSENMNEMMKQKEGRENI